MYDEGGFAVADGVDTPLLEGCVSTVSRQNMIQLAPFTRQCSMRPGTRLFELRHVGCVNNPGEKISLLQAY